MHAGPSIADSPLWPQGVGIRLLDEVDSTNAEASRLAVVLTQPTWIMARRQTGGRGRRGREWFVGPGNLAVSLYMQLGGRADQAALRSFVAALALSDALQTVIGPGATLSLKWPNDVLLNGGKVAGILLEGIGTGNRLDGLIVGVGVNLAESPPSDALEPGAVPAVSVLGETGVRIEPDVFLPYLATSFAQHEARFLTYGFGPVRSAWLARAARIGQSIRARTATESIEGRFETVAQDGALVLATATGKRHIPAADIFF